MKLCCCKQNFVKNKMAGSKSKAAKWFSPLFCIGEIYTVLLHQGAVVCTCRALLPTDMEFCMLLVWASTSFCRALCWAASDLLQVTHMVVSFAQVRLLISLATSHDWSSHTMKPVILIGSSVRNFLAQHYKAQLHTTGGTIIQVQDTKGVLSSQTHHYPSR